MSSFSISQEYFLSFLIFVVGALVVTYLNSRYAKVFERAAPKDASETTRQLSITFVSGHLLAYFALPFAIIVGASLAIVGKLDAGVSTIIGMIVGYVVREVSTR